MNIDESMKQDRDRVVEGINQDKLILEGLAEQIKLKEKELTDLVKSLEVSNTNFQSVKDSNLIIIERFNKEVNTLNEKLESTKKLIAEQEINLDLVVSNLKNLNDNKLESEANIRKVIAEGEKESKKLAELQSQKEKLNAELLELKNTKSKLVKDNNDLVVLLEKKMSEQSVLESKSLESLDRLNQFDIKMKDANKNLEELELSKKELLDSISVLQKDIEALELKKESESKKIEKLIVSIEERSLSLSNKELYLEQKEEKLRKKFKELHIPYEAYQAPEVINN